MIKSLLLSALALLAPLGSFARAQTCSPTPFVQATHLLTGRNIVSVAVGDVNGDTFLDIVALANDNTVYVILGAGDGSFLPPSGPVATFNYYSGAILLLDLNHDGMPDLVVGETSEIETAIGNGDGTFQAPVSSPFPMFRQYANPVTMAAGFFDGDTNVDLVLSSSYPYSGGSSPITVFKGNGDGTFSSPHDLVAGSGGHRLAVADLNADSYVDIVATNSLDGTISVFRGDASGSFVAPRLDFAAGSNPFDLAVADIDGDGKLDVAISLPSFVSVLRGDGDGTFEAAYEYPTSQGPGPILATDLNGDGKADVALTSPTLYCCGAPSTFSILIATANAVLEPPANYLAPSSPAAMSLGDFAGDGAKDFVIAGSDGIAILEGLGSLQFLSAPVLPVTSYAVGDIDEDGRPEILSSNGNSISASSWAPNGTFDTAVVSTLPFPVNVLAAGDFDGDGHLDLIVARTNVSPNPLSFLRGHGNRTFGLPLDIATGDFGVNQAVVGDFNGDGNLDFVTSSPYESTQRVFYGHGDATFQPAVAVEPSFFGTSKAADVNGDGFTDLVVISTQNGSPSTLSIFLGSATGLGTQLTQQVAGTSVDVFDLDGDGKKDLIVAGGPNLALYRGNGDGTFQDPIYIGLAGPPQRAVAGDFDGDGISDIASVQNGHLSFLRGLGGIAFDAPTDQFMSGNATGLAALDITGGGVPDLLVNLDFGGGQTGLVVFASVRLAAMAPKSETACLGSAVTLKTSASGFGPVQYQWRKGGVPLSDGSGITGVSTSILSIASASLSDQGSYDVVVTDLCTTKTSAPATLSIVTPPAAPTIPTRSVSSGTAFIHVVLAAPAPAGAVVLLNGIVGVMTPGASDIEFSVPTPAPPGGSFGVTVVELANGCSSPQASRTISVDFNDVPAGNPFREFVNTVARNGVTSGCSPGEYCPDTAVTRSQMAVFLLRSNDGPTYVPPACSTPTFPDVPCSSGFAPWVDELAARGVTAGCGGGDYCPLSPVTRAQMAVFLLRTHDGPTYVPPACTVAPFADVPCSSPFAPWIQELVVRGIAAGCGGGNYCPDASVSRAQMAVLLVETFSLQ